jgi:predicted RNase H-like HicB family nuclease
MDYYANFEEFDDGSCSLECPYFKGCYGTGDTLEEAIENLKEVIQMCLSEVETEGLGPVCRPRFREMKLSEDAHVINIKIVGDC